MSSTRFKIMILFLIVPSCFAFYNTLPPTTLSTTHSVSNEICNRPISPLQQGPLCIHQKMITNQQYTALRKPSSLYFIQGTWNILSLSDPIAALPSFGLNALLFFILQSKLLKMLTPTGMAHSLALGTMLCMTLGWRGWFACVLYLFLGSFVTKVKFQEKKDLGIEEKREGKRGPENVWGSALTGLICAACASQGPSFLGIRSDLFVLAFVTSLATKLSDTFASEIGKAYGKTTFLFTTMEKVPPGTEGAISLEGSVAALLGALPLPLYACAVQLIPFNAILLATISAFLATFAESWIGAAIQNKKGFEFMTNEVVNFVNTLIGASLALAGGMILL